MTFLAGLIVGVTLALLVLAFLAIGSFDRGYEQASARRRELCRELETHHTPAARKAFVANHALVVRHAH